MTWHSSNLQDNFIFSRLEILQAARVPCFKVHDSVSAFLDSEENENLVQVFSQTKTVLGAFATLRKATISFITSVCLSVRMEQLGSHWTHFDET